MWKKIAKLLWVTKITEIIKSTKKFLKNSRTQVIRWKKLKIQ